jgi:ATP-dependent Lhr-like helicase
MQLPENFQAWFESNGWHPHEHQLAMVEAAKGGHSCLLIAPTGGGKTLAGFLPSLIQLSERPRPGLHTLYISPLKALAVDIHRNLERPLAEMRLPIAAETRTGDTPEAKRQRQRKRPPNILMTTPESLSLMISHADADKVFAGVGVIIIDELHALIGTKRGDLLALALSRLTRFAPNARRVGLSATVADPDPLRAYLSRAADPDDARVKTILGPPSPKPIITTHVTRGRMPWMGRMAVHAIEDAYETIARAKMAIIFVNTRAQAELVFQELWRVNAANLPIGLHHGSLAPEQRRRVESAMSSGELKAVVATSSLDLGIDWGDVDLVLQVGAPKGASRLMQRIGRANHRFDEPSEALLIPGNRFEYFECQAAIDAIAEGTLDGTPIYPGGLDVLAQHVMGVACHGAFLPDELYAEVLTASPYAELSRRDFDDVVQFVATGGYALGNYERFRRLEKVEDGSYRLAHPALARQYRMNMGTIVASATMKVRLGRGGTLGEIEEYFVQQLVPGDTFVFAGRLLKFTGLRENTVMCALGGEGDPKVPAYAGGRMPLTTELADRVRAMLADSRQWDHLPADVQEWLRLQEWRSELPSRDGLLVETFPRETRCYLVAYCFEGRNAHQTLGMLLTRRMERAGYKPLGFVATDYVVAVWSLKPVRDVDGLFDQDMLGDDLEDWMAESSLLKRTFRNVAVIAGLIERHHPGMEKKSGRQVTVNSDLIYDVLRQHEPDHILLRATRQDAARGLTDIKRVSDMLKRVQGKITTRRLDRVSPLAVPILLTIGREPVYGNRADDLLEAAEEELVREATEAF